MGPLTREPKRSNSAKSHPKRKSPHNKQLEMLFTISFLLAQLQALHTLAQTGHDLAERAQSGFATPDIWDAIMTSLSVQMDVLRELSVVWQL